MSGREAGPLRVWVLSDGHAGHFNLSLGVLQALRRVRPVQETRIDIRLRFGFARNLLRFLLNHTRRPLPQRLLELFCEVGELPEQGCDLLLSAGGRTSFANAWLARRLGVPNIFIGSLRRLQPRLFSVVLTLEPADVTPVSLLLEIPPCRIDEEQLSQQGARLREQHELGSQPCWCMQIGGNGAGYRYREEDWQALAQAMNRLAAYHGIRWLVVSSRRTGSTAAQLLRRLLQPDSLALQCWHDLGDEYPAAAFLGAAEKLFVTEDSMTMLGEAMSARKPVYSLRPRQLRPNSRYSNMIWRFADRRLLCRFSIEALALQPELVNKAECQVLAFSAQQQLAEQLSERLEMDVSPEGDATES